jgi:hypothetical protein
MLHGIWLLPSVWHKRRMSTEQHMLTAASVQPENEGRNPSRVYSQAGLQLDAARVFADQRVQLSKAPIVNGLQRRRRVVLAWAWWGQGNNRLSTAY